MPPVSKVPRLIGMIHLGPLPGSPQFDGDFEAVIRNAVEDARTLEIAGFEGLMIENFGDAPFFATEVPKITVAAMTRAALAVRSACSLPIGINVLRNDGGAALAIAAAVGAAYVRINVLSGTMFTDQGPIVGEAATLGRLRAQLDPSIAILADVFVKHAVPPAGLELEHAVAELSGRGGADAIIASGSGTGSPPTVDHIATVKASAASKPVFVGSGTTAQTAAEFLSVADGLIVGSATKPGGAVDRPVSGELAAAIVAACDRAE